MELMIAKLIGKTRYTFVVKGNDLHEVLMDAEKLSFQDVPTCGLCHSDDLFLTAYVTKEEHYKYAKIVCRKCKGSVTFGQQKKDPAIFYLRKTDDGKLDWQKYVEPEERSGK